MIFSLYILWIIFNGRITAEIAVIGLVVCLSLYFFLYKFLGYNLKKDISSLKTIPKFVVFLLVLFFQIVISNINVIKIILSPKKKPKSEIVEFETDIKSVNLRCLFANSITITPGTYTVALKDGRYSVHSLTPDFSNHLNRSGVLRCIKKMEDKNI